MKDMKKLLENADNEILDELIQACEAKMGSKFKKEEPKEESEIEVVSVEDEDEDEMDDEKLQKLLEMYKNSK